MALKYLLVNLLRRSILSLKLIDEVLPVGRKGVELGLILLGGLHESPGLEAPQGGVDAPRFDVPDALELVPQEL